MNFCIIDIDECTQDGICPPPGTCINTLGSYRCMCPKGHKLDTSGTYCVNLAECPGGNCEIKCKVRSLKYRNILLFMDFSITMVIIIER